MDFEAAKVWLEGFTNKRIRNCHMAGIVAIVFVPVALAVASVFCYVLLRLLTYREYGSDSKTACIWISFGLIPLMFLGNRLMPRRNLMEERMSEGTPHFTGKGEVYLQFFLWFMFAGPRLLDWGLASFRESKRLQTQDTHSCAAILWLMLTRQKKVSFDEMQKELPWLNLETAVPETLAIAGVVKLQGPPAGLSMTQELREAVRSRK